MSDTTDLRERLRTRLEQVRVRLRDLELDATLVRGRTEEAREEEAALMEVLDDSPRRRPGRPRRGTVMEIPQRVAGGSAETETDEQGPLPSIDDVRGILKPDGEAA